MYCGGSEAVFFTSMFWQQLIIACRYVINGFKNTYTTCTGGFITMRKITELCNGCPYTNKSGDTCKRYPDPSAFVRRVQDSVILMCPSSKLNDKSDDDTSKKRVGQQKQKRSAW
jgi:hypothetical protein